MKYLILGATGMAGHLVTIYLAEQGHDVTAYTRKPAGYGIKNILGDASDYKELKSIIERDSYDVIVNGIGILNNYAEENKAAAVLLNSFLPHYLSSVLKESKTKLIHLSTDCVFSGDKGGYHEAVFPEGRKFYDRSKALGEVTDGANLTLRTSIIGPDLNEDGIGLFNWFMKQKEEIKGFTKAIWTGVTTLTLAKAIEAAAQQDLNGLYHLVNNTSISKFELLIFFNRYFKNDNLRIIPDDSIRIDKSLVNSRTDFEFTVPCYEDMIVQMYDWIDSHKMLYSHYFK